MSAKEIISIVFAACFCFAATSGATAQEFSATSEALVQELLRKPTSLTGLESETLSAYYGNLPPGESAPLTLSIRVMGDDFKVGDAIPVEFTLANIGTVNYAWRDLGQGANRRRAEYVLTVQDANGQRVTDPIGYDDSSGIGGTRVLMPGEKYSRTTYLNSWALVTTPGTYQIAGVYKRDITFRPGDVPHNNPISVASRPISVAIKPRSEAEMDEYIRSLATQLTTPSDANDIVVRLSFTGSPKIVPLMIDSMYSDWGAYAQYAELALMGYVPKSEEIWAQIYATANQRGLRGSMLELLEKYDLKLHGADKKQITAASMFPIIMRSLVGDNSQCWAQGAEAARRYPSSAFMPLLIAIALTPGPVPGQPRDNAIYALGEYRTDESVRALHLLLTDPDPAIRRLTEDHIRNTYQNRNRTNDPSHYLRDDDFDASFR